MSDSEKFSNNSPDLQDALRSIGAIGEDAGAITGDGPDTADADTDESEATVPDGDVKSDAPETTESGR
jgi:hypothetical protein